MCTFFKVGSHLSQVSQVLFLLSVIASHYHFTQHTMPPRCNTQKKATVPPSPPISSRIRKQGPSNADDKQSKPKEKKQRGDDNEVSEVSEAERKATGSKQKVKKGKKTKIR